MCRQEASRLNALLQVCGEMLSLIPQTVLGSPLFVGARLRASLCPRSYHSPFAIPCEPFPRIAPEGAPTGLRRNCVSRFAFPISCSRLPTPCFTAHRSAKTSITGCTCSSRSSARPRRCRRSPSSLELSAQIVACPTLRPGRGDFP